MAKSNRAHTTPLTRALLLGQDGAMGRSLSPSNQQRYYLKLIEEFQRFVADNLPSDATIAVVSRGDPALTKLGGCTVWHFPRDENNKYAGYYPADSKAATSHLEELRRDGAEFFALPATSLWWLDYYPQLRLHLEHYYRIIADCPDQFVIFDLRRKRRPRRTDRPRLALVPKATPGDKVSTVGGHRGGVAARHALLGWFDPDFYRLSNPDLSGSNPHLLNHYLSDGWREGRDPCAWFSTKYYLSRYSDIRDAGLNPFLHYLTHGREEGRLPQEYRAILDARSYRPTVTAVVPNYNHAAFLQERIRSIGRQTYQPCEIILLDDASTDASRNVMEAVAAEFQIPVRHAYNVQRSGRIFSQWRKGIRLARGDLIWLCESDDFAEDTFLERLIPHLADPSVTLGFGRIQFSTASGEVDPWLDEYREQAGAGRWDAPRIESAYEWFRGPFGLANVIPNVGGCLFRRQDLPASVWRHAGRFSVCGDWYLYMHLAGGGRIVYEPSAVSYFRQHGANSSVVSFSERRYYREHYRIATELCRTFGLEDDQVWQFYHRVREHYFRHCAAASVKEFHAEFPVQKLLEQQRTVCNILVGMLGFQTGGGELFPIHLANALRERGHNVSVFVLDTERENPAIRSLLRAGIPVYRAGGSRGHREA